MYELLNKLIPINEWLSIKNYYIYKDVFNYFNTLHKKYRNEKTFLILIL